MIDIKLLNEHAYKLFTPKQINLAGERIDVENYLIDLLHTEIWSASQLTFFQGWLKKIDITKKQFTHYQNNWKVTEKKVEIKTGLYQLTVLLALRYVYEINGRAVNQEHKLKTINAIFKALDHIEGDIFSVKKTLIESELVTLLSALKPSEKISNKPLAPVQEPSDHLAITVLFSEGPIARAYMATIKEMGYKVKKIIKLVSSVDLVSKKPVGGLLPRSMKVNYAANKQFKQMFYWSNQYQKTATEAIDVIQTQVRNEFGFQSSALDEANRNTDLNEYSDDVESLFITGLKDPVLEKKLVKESGNLFLYTGGGIVPDHLLSIDEKRLIHIHPGFLPEIRGADCVLWSQLLTKKTSATAFFMAPGIDVGDIILPIWLPGVDLNFPKNVDSRVKYRLIYGFLDPWVRAYVLKQLIYSTKELAEYIVTPQDENEGMTYHFMHEFIKQHVFRQFK